MMSFKKFERLVLAIREQAKGSYDGGDHIKYLCPEYYECRERFDDKRDNLMHWLLHEPCEFYNERQHRECYVKIGDDIETIYCFLRVVKMMSHGRQLSDDAANYLDYLIQNSTEGENDEEYDHENENYDDEYCEEKYEFADFD